MHEHLSKSHYYQKKKNVCLGVDDVLEEDGGGSSVRVIE